MLQFLNRNNKSGFSIFEAFSLDKVAKCIGAIDWNRLQNFQMEFAGNEQKQVLEVLGNNTKE